MDIRPVGYMIFDFQGVGTVLELIARRHHPPGHEETDPAGGESAGVGGVWAGRGMFTERLSARTTTSSKVAGS